MRRMLEFAAWSWAVMRHRWWLAIVYTLIFAVAIYIDGFGSLMSNVGLVIVLATVSWWCVAMQLALMNGGE